jgi:hypothetical protein
VAQTGGADPTLGDQISTGHNSSCSDRNSARMCARRVARALKPLPRLPCRAQTIPFPQASIPMLLSLGLAGLPFSGADVGGFL